MIGGAKTKVLEEKPTPDLLHLPQILHRVPLD
jgi:hypothetical protein